MHIETLKVFCDIIESGSFSYAASQNFVTQSAVSQQVRSLEDKYDCRLIERGAGRSQTDRGRADSVQREQGDRPAVHGAGESAARDRFGGRRFDSGRNGLQRRIARAAPIPDRIPAQFSRRQRSSRISALEQDLRGPGRRQDRSGRGRVSGQAQPDRDDRLSARRISAGGATRQCTGQAEQGQLRPARRPAIRRLRARHPDPQGCRPDLA